MIHHLKLEDRWFREIEHRKKTFEVRYDDRGYMPGDYLILEEVTKNVDGTIEYTGFMITAIVTYILRAEDFPSGLKDGYVVMSIEVMGLGKKLSNERYKELMG